MSAGAQSFRRASAVRTSRQYVRNLIRKFSTGVDLPRPQPQAVHVAAVCEGSGIARDAKSGESMLIIRLSCNVE